LVPSGSSNEFASWRSSRVATACVRVRTYAGKPQLLAPGSSGDAARRELHQQVCAAASHQPRGTCIWTGTSEAERDVYCDWCARLRTLTPPDRHHPCAACAHPRAGVTRTPEQTICGRSWDCTVPIRCLHRISTSSPRRASCSTAPTCKSRSVALRVRSSSSRRLLVVQSIGSASWSSWLSCDSTGSSAQPSHNSCLRWSA
jgi:hypothetical protein